MTETAKSSATVGFRVVAGEQVDADRVDRFLRDNGFSRAKCDFLRDYGSWRHRHDRHRLLVLNDSDEIVGYCAAIPAPVWVGDREASGLFWVDNFVPPRWRGKRIQSLTDRAIRDMDELCLGFPNAKVAPIHRKHGWDVREDAKVLVLPLAPRQMVRLHVRSERARPILLLAGLVSAPAASLARRWLARYQPLTARMVKAPDPEFLANIFRRYRDGWITTNRTAEYLQWRYSQSPHAGEHSFFLGGPGSEPSLAAICRTFLRMGARVTRLLDVFGNLGDSQSLLDMLRLATSEAVHHGSCQISAISSNQVMASVLRRAGYWIGVTARTRCFCRDAEMMRRVARGPCHWVYGDSDNDSID